MNETLSDSTTGTPLAGTSSVYRRAVYDTFELPEEPTSDNNRTKRFHKNGTCIQLKLHDAAEPATKRRTRTARAADPCTRLHSDVANSNSSSFLVVVDLSDLVRGSQTCPCGSLSDER